MESINFLMEDKEVEIFLRFKAWKMNLIDKWEVYPFCYEYIKNNLISKSFVVDTAKEICDIKSEVVDMRLDDISKM